MSKAPDNGAWLRRPRREAPCGKGLRQGPDANVNAERLVKCSFAFRSHRNTPEKGTAMSNFLKLAAERYSCRKFTDRPVEPEKVEKVLEAAICAPTAVNKQPWHAWVITGEEALEKVNACTRFGFGAKVVIAVGAKADEGWTRKFDGRAFADVDATIVATHMMLEVQDLGLGTTWVGHFDAPALAEALPELSGYDLIALFPIGYPDPTYEPAPGHSQSKDKADLVSYL